MNKNEIILYETADSAVKLRVNTDGDTVWLNRTQLAELFDRDIKTIGKHINNILKEELSGDSSVVANFATTSTDGKTYRCGRFSKNRPRFLHCHKKIPHIKQCRGNVAISCLSRIPLAASAI
jgi:hypothetical protein